MALERQAVPVPGAQSRIIEEVAAWKGVTAAPHRFGGLEFRVGRRELVHVHGDALVDIPFPRKLRDEIVASGRGQPHHVLPESGWIRVFLRAEPDVERAIELLRLSFSLALQHRRGSAGVGDTHPS